MVPWVVSAKSAAALAAQASRLAESIGAREQLGIADVGWSLAGRSTFEHRAVVLGRDRGQLLAGLAELADGMPGGSVITGHAAPAGKTVFVFPGQGSQWIGMGVELLDSAPVFAAQMNACAEAFAEFVDWSLIDVLRGTPGAPGLDRVDVVQPALFAVMVSLAEVWRSIGVRPDAVIGHSQGEIAAAYVAGALSLRDAARVVTLRSKLLLALSGRGGMVSLACGTDQARELLAPCGDRVSIAAINGRSAVVLSGEVAALDEIVVQCTERELRARRIDVDYASHSVAVDAIREQLAEALAGIEPQSARTAFFSTVTGDVVDTAELTADYWFRNIRQTVEFASAVRTASASGYRTFIESSPHPALIAGIEDTATDGGADAVVVPTLGREDGGLIRFLSSAAQAFVSGVKVDWRAAVPGAGFVELPTYAFERRRFWLSGDGAAIDAAGLGLGASEHALLGAVVELPDSGGVVLTGRLSPATQGWLNDHAVDGLAVFPGAGFVELAIRAGDEVGCPVVDELTLQAPLLLPSSGSVAVAAGGGCRRRIRSAQSVRILQGALRFRMDLPCDGAVVIRTGRAGRRPVGVAARRRDSRRCDRRLPAVGGARLPVRPGVPGVDRAVASRRGVLRRSHGAASGRRCRRIRCASGAPGCGPARGGGDVRTAEVAEIALPFSWQGVSLHAAGASSVRARIAPSGPSAVSVELADGLGLPVLTVTSMIARPISQQQLMAAVSGNTGDRLFELAWSPTSAASPAETPAYEVFESVSAAGDPVSAQLRTRPRSSGGAAVVADRT